MNDDSFHKAAPPPLYPPLDPAASAPPFAPTPPYAAFAAPPPPPLSPLSPPGGADVAEPVVPAPAWESDAGAACGLCKRAFGVFLWRHHCRNHGGLVCADCSADAVSLTWLGMREPQRVCTLCSRMLAAADGDGAAGPPFDARCAAPVSLEGRWERAELAPPADLPYASVTLGGGAPDAGAPLPPPFEPGVDALIARDPRRARAVAIAAALGIPVRYCRDVGVFVVCLCDWNAAARGPESVSVTVSIGQERFTTPVLRAFPTGPVGARFFAGGTLHVDARNERSPLVFDVRAPSTAAQAAVDVARLPHGRRDYVVAAVGGARLLVIVDAPVPRLDNFSFTLEHEFFSFGDFVVRTDVGHPAFRFTGSWPNEYHMADAAGRPLLLVKRRSFFAVEPSYDVVAKATGALVLSITKRLSFASFAFSVEGPTGLPADLAVHGDFLACSFTWTRAGVPVAWIARPWHTTQSFSLAVAPTEDPAIYMAATVVIYRCLIEARR